LRIIPRLPAGIRRLFDIRIADLSGAGSTPASPPPWKQITETEDQLFGDDGERRT
jgi:hypothetical protein